MGASSGKTKKKRGGHSNVVVCIQLRDNVALWQEVRGRGIGQSGWMMDVRCENCQFEYEFDPVQLKPGGVLVKCFNCEHVFRLNSDADEASQETAESSEGENTTTVPWQVRLEDGTVHTVEALQVLQAWIVQGTITRESSISKDRKTWKRLGDVPGLAPYFDIVPPAVGGADPGKQSGPVRSDRWVGSSKAALVREPTGPVSGQFAGTGSGGNVAFAGNTNGNTNGNANEPSPQTGASLASQDDLDPVQSKVGRWVAVLAVVVLAGACIAIYTVFRMSEPDAPLVGHQRDAASGELDAATIVANDAGREIDETLMADAEAALRLDDHQALVTVMSRFSDSSETISLGEQAVRARVVLGVSQHVLLSGVRQSPKRARFRLARAQKLARKAEAIARQIHAQDSRRVDALLAIADALRVDGKSTREVERALRRAAHDPSASAEIALIRARLHSRDRRPRKARAVLVAVADRLLKQKDVRGYYALAVLETGESQLEAAKLAAKQVLSVHPGHKGAQQIVKQMAPAVESIPPASPGIPAIKKPTTAELLARARAAKCNQATVLYRQVLDTNPSHLAALAGLGQCLLSTGDYTGAQARFRAALAVSSRHAGALYGLAEAYRRQGRHDQAISAYQRYLNAHGAGAKAGSARKHIEGLRTRSAPPVAPRPVAPVPKPAPIPPVVPPPAAPVLKPAPIPPVAPRPAAPAPKPAPIPPVAPPPVAPVAPKEATKSRPKGSVAKRGDKKPSEKKPRGLAPAIDSPPNPPKE